MPAIGEAGGVARSHAYDTSGEPSASEAGDAYVLAFGEASDQSQRLGIQHDRVLNDTGNMKDIRVSVEPPSRSPSDASASSGRAEISQSFLDYHYKVPTSPRPWSTHNYSPHPYESPYPYPDPAARQFMELPSLPPSPPPKSPRPLRLAQSAPNLRGPSSEADAELKAILGRTFYVDESGVEQEIAGERLERLTDFQRSRYSLAKENLQRKGVPDKLATPMADARLKLYAMTQGQPPTRKGVETTLSEPVSRDENASTKGKQKLPLAGPYGYDQLPQQTQQVVDRWRAKPGRELSRSTLRSPTNSFAASPASRIHGDLLAPSDAVAAAPRGELIEHGREQQYPPAAVPAAATSSGSRSFGSFSETNSPRRAALANHLADQDSGSGTIRPVRSDTSRRVADDLRAAHAVI